MANTPRPGEIIVSPAFSSTPRENGKNGSYAFPSTGILPLLTYKNQGYYTAGGVFEQWLSSPLPSLIPPSGHTLADIQHTVLQ